MLKSANTEVSALQSGAGGLTWTENDGALPMPLDPKDAALQLAVRSSDFLEAMDQEPLKVTGLPAARYALESMASASGCSRIPSLPKA